MMKVCVIRLCIRAALLAGMLSCARGSELRAQSSAPETHTSLSPDRKTQQPGSAISVYHHATEVAPGSFEGWRELFLAQLRDQQALAALTTFQRMPERVRVQLKGDPSFLDHLASAYAEAGRTAEVQATLEDALKLPFMPDQNALKVEIQIELAGALSSANQPDQAVALYRLVVAEDGASTVAWQRLLRLQVAMGRNQDAFDTVQRMPPATYDAAMRAVDFKVTVASIYESLKQLDLAQNLLQKAVTEQANAGQRPSPTIEMQLANIYAERGNPQLAYPVYQQVLRENPERVDAWAGLLSALHVTGHDKELVAQVALIPAGARRQLETNQNYLQTMAAAQARIGQTQKVAQLQERVVQEDAPRRSTPSVGVEIQRAWLLYNSMDDAGLYTQLMNLGSQSDLTAKQRRTIETIWTNWAARRADQASARENSRMAVAILNAAAGAFADNPEAIKLLAAPYVQAGQPHQAVLIYKAQNMASATTSEYQAAVAAALADGDNKDAEAWLHYAMTASPTDPQILILAARVEQARGDTSRAIQYYRSSLQAMPPVSSVSKLAPDLGLQASSAPASLPSSAQPQDLSVLLAPGYIETPQTGGQPYAPNATRAPLPPYDGTTQLVPPFVGNPHGIKNGNAPRASVSPQVASAVHDASTRAVGPTSAAIVAVKSQRPISAEVYSAYVPYMAPTRVAREIGYQPATIPAIAMQPGKDPVTNALPAARYGSTAKANQAMTSHDQVAAPRAERILHLQEGAAERSGQSHPPSSETMTGVMQDAQYSHVQIPRPSSPPAGYGAAPDTGAQQYPQPRTPSGSDRAIITRSCPVQHTPASSHSQATAPEVSVTKPSVTGTPVPAVTTSAGTQGTGSVAAADMPSRAITQGGTASGAEDALPPPPTDAELQSRSMLPLGGLNSSRASIGQTPRQQAEDELAALEGSYSGWLGATGIGRYRSGIAGLDRLYDLESPVEASAVVGQKVRLTAVVEPVFLNSGTLNPADFLGPNVPYLGTMALDAENLPPQQYFNGVGGELQVAAKSFALAIGYAPYEFPVRNITGRFLWNGIGNHVSFFGDREPVKDTLLSYVGMHDPGSALPLAQSPVWGGVIASTGGLRLQFGDTARSFFVSGEGGILTGTHVLDNYRFKGAIGAAFRIKTWANAGELRLDATLSGMHYQHNEVGLSYGQGGYFSPDTYFAGSAPIRFIGHYKANFHYTVAGSLGMQTFQQNAAPFYPLDPELQASLVASQGAACTSALAATYICGEYPQVVSTQFNYSVNSEASYRFGDHWYGGGFVVANNSNNFNTVSAGYFLRFVFHAKRSQQGYPAGLFQMDGLRSLQIP